MAKLMRVDMLEADLLGGRHQRLFEVELADNGGVQVFVGRPDNGVVAVTALRESPPKSGHTEESIYLA